jgi:hypothetical protein
MENDSGETQNAFELLRIDFEQRSQQVTRMAMDRSSFLRIALLIWGAPLAVSAALLKDPSLGGQVLPWLSIPFVSGLSFLLASLANCIVLAAIVGNRNTANLSASGMNFIRALYFRTLTVRKLISIDRELRTIIGLTSELRPRFQVVVSRSTDLVIVMFTATNMSFLLVGFYLCCSARLGHLLISGIILALVIACHAIIIRRISLRCVLRDQ